jgi:peptide chain release factor 2
MALSERRDEVAALRVRLHEAEGYLKATELVAEKDRIEAELSDADIWANDPEKARGLGADLAAINDDLHSLHGLESKVEDAETLMELGLAEGDESLEQELLVTIDDASKIARTLELRSLFTGDYDVNDALLEVHSGAGGVDAQDWAEMLLRMYLRWAEDRGFVTEIEYRQDGNEAGISSVMVLVKGRYVYGLLSAERGVHRLVRISPFDGQARRQTSFAGVSLTPVIPDAASKIEIDDKDLRVDVFRSSGAGGQHVNTTDSAVRMTHLPTGIVVSCQIERSQIQNRARAMDMLAIKLLERARQEADAKMASITGPQKDAAWGNQIRSYVMAPYQMVKDLRTSHETGNVTSVLDGDLDQFMESWLRWRRTEGE